MEKCLYFGNKRANRFPGILIYDEEELNSGAFPVKPGGKLMFAGFNSPITHDSKILIDFFIPFQIIELIFFTLSNTIS